LHWQIISPEDMVGYSEQSKGSQITKVFEDAYKSPLSIVVLVSAVHAVFTFGVPAMQTLNSIQCVLGG
jgi:hypothetical protein